MRLALYLPIAYVAGVHGFAIFAPYLVLFLAAALLLRRRRAATLVTLPLRDDRQVAMAPILQK